MNCLKQKNKHLYQYFRGFGAMVTGFMVTFIKQVMGCFYMYYKVMYLKLYNQLNL